MTQSPAQIVKTFWDTYTNRDLEGCLQYLHDDLQVYRNAEGPMSKDQYKDVGAMFLAGFDPIRFELLSKVESDDMVATHYIIHLTHVGPFQGVPATGRNIAVRNTMIDRIQDGKIIERREVSDDLSIMMQLGAIPAPAH